ncbi:MAG: HAMP domain-containing sensor histidine kinase [Owenweeksia sp.]
MDFYGKKNLWKFILFVFAVLIGAATLWYTESFLNELRKEEIKKVNQFGEAMNNILHTDSTCEILFEQMVIEANTTIPIIVVDDAGNVMTSRNIDTDKLRDQKWLTSKLDEMREQADPIEADLGLGEKQYIYYQNSILLTKLRYYPIVLLIVISLFVIIAYIAFSNARKAEQNQVWNGLAKETAHQIGTPLTSLMGWLELLRNKEENSTMVTEMEKDINRLNTITQRFSKIGSQPSIKLHDVVGVVRTSVEYLQNRSPRKIEIISDLPEGESMVELNKELFEWVIENLIRNAIDAMETGKGKITVNMVETARSVRIDVKDTGKGIAQNKFKAVFRPGYTTKSRGWGLGLSLAKRIIEEYHNGRIYVAASEIGSGTTFRIQLRKPRV